MEPTGNYSKLWINTLLEAGKEVRLISNRDLTAYRKLCNWDYKDDYHDAAALVYCGWLNLNNLSFFLSLKDPEINSIYQLFLEHEKINRELVPLVNRARNLLHTEFPEAKNSKTQSSDNVDGIWLFIASKPLAQKSQSYWTKRLSRSIGTANKTGFTNSLKKTCNQIVNLKLRRIAIKRRFEEFLLSPEYGFYLEAFAKFELGIYENLIILCQIYPFSQFLDADGNELRKPYPKKFGKSGKPVTKRVGLNRFHAKLGKAIKPWESGKKKGHIVTGSSLARKRIFLWAHRIINLKSQKNLSPKLEMLVRRNKIDVGCVFLENGELDPNYSPKDSLKRWAKCRIGDKLVKELFKELIGAYRRSKEW